MNGCVLSFVYFVLSETEGFLYRDILKNKNSKINLNFAKVITNLSNSIFTIGFSLESTITILYWVAIYPTDFDLEPRPDLPPSLGDRGRGKIEFWVTVALHGGLWAILWIDLFLNRVRI